MQRHLLVLLLLLLPAGPAAAQTLPLPGGDSLVLDLNATAHEPVVLRRSGGLTRFAWSLADLVPGVEVTTFDAPDGHWSAGWWIDPAERVLALAVHAAERPPPFGSAPPTWVGVPLDGRSPAPLALSVLRRRAGIVGGAFEAIEFPSNTALLDTLTTTLADPDASLVLRLHAEIALRRLGQPALALVALHADDRTRAGHSTAIRLLPALRGPAAIPRLLDHVRDAADGSGLAGIESLGSLGHGAALLPLAEDLTGRWLVREAAARGLGDTGDPAFVAPLIALLDGARSPLVDALVPSILALPGGRDALGTWAVNGARSEQLARSCARTRSSPCSTVIEALTRRRLLETRSAAHALSRSWLGRRALNRLLRDAILPSEPLVATFAALPGPAAEEGLLAELQRLAPGLGPQWELARALRGSVELAPLVAALERGHAADATLAATLLGPRDQVSPAHAPAFRAALRRHLDPRDPALPILVRAAATLNDRSTTALLAPLLGQDPPKHTVTTIARLAREHPDVEATGPLLTAMARFVGDHWACAAVAGALERRPLREEDVARLEDLVDAGAAACVAEVVRRSPVPRITTALAGWLVDHPGTDHVGSVVRALQRARDPVAIPGLEAALAGRWAGEAVRALDAIGAEGLLALGRGLEAGVAPDRLLLGPLHGRSFQTPAGVLPGILAALSRVESVPPKERTPRALRPIVSALGQVDADVTPYLRPYLDDPTAPRIIVVRHLGKRRDTASIPRLRQLLREVEFDERDAVLEALARMGDASIVRTLAFELSILPRPHRRERFYVRQLERLVPEAEQPLRGSTEAWRAWAAEL